MFKADAQEAAPIAQRAMTLLLGTVPTRGLAGSQLRTAVGDFNVRAEYFIQTDSAGPELIACFDAAIANNVTQKQLAFIRSKIIGETPILLGAVLIKNVLIGLCLTYECQIIAGMAFASRQDVNLLRIQMNSAFDGIEEIAADDMDAVTYQSIVGLHAALNLHLIERARPLPRLLQYQFNSVLPTLIIGHKLYDDAGRADELRAENHTIHPAFCQLQGLALSA